ncbi:MAG TPA: hypothetical protein PK777_00770, partial [Thermoguttaceae bacterium]|nr:hypothetical protein [Thermoguttaceae bacterium]
ITPKVLADLEIQPEEYPYGLVQLDRLRLVVGRSRRWRFRISAHQYSIRRAEFDGWLLERSGAEVVQHTVREIRYAGGRYIVDGQFSCTYLVGAGGTSCPVRRNLFPPHPGKLILTREAELPGEPLGNECILWFPFAGQSGYAWYVPKRGGVHIGFGGLADQIPTEGLASLWEEFTRLLDGEDSVGDMSPPTPKGHPYFLNPLNTPIKQNGAYLVGDAAGLATWDLAEGIGPAIQSGILAARDILGLDIYQRERVGRYSLGLLGRFFRWVWARLP